MWRCESFLLVANQHCSASVHYSRYRTKKQVLQGLLLCKADHKYKTNNQLFPVLFKDQLKPAGSTAACSIPLTLFTKERLLATPITSVKHSWGFWRTYRWFRKGTSCHFCSASQTSTEINQKKVSFNCAKEHTPRKLHAAFSFPICAFNHVFKNMRFCWVCRRNSWTVDLSKQNLWHLFVMFSDILLSIKLFQELQHHPMWINHKMKGDNSPLMEKLW